MSSTLLPPWLSVAPVLPAGGEGGLGGTLLGALLIETLNNGLNLLNVSPLWEQVVKGVVIALALLLYKAFSPPSR